VVVSSVIPALEEAQEDRGPKLSPGKNNNNKKTPSEKYLKQKGIVMWLRWCLTSEGPWFKPKYFSPPKTKKRRNGYIHQALSEAILKHEPKTQTKPCTWVLTTA
jgi:hypothetical protein